jgi:hypothetical protein
MRALSTLLITAAALALAGGTASAQSRDGFFVGAGLGWGSAKANADEFDLGQNDRQGSWTLNLRVGKTLSERLGVGAELNGWFDEEDGDGVALFNTTVAAYYYPSGNQLFAKVGVGLSRADFDIGSERVSGLGLGFMAGVGYDIPIGSGSTAFTPQATFWYGKPGDLSLDDIEVLHGFRHNVFELGVGITFY